MSKTLYGVLARLRGSIAILLIAGLFAPHLKSADDNFMKGKVLGKNGSEKALAGVSVQEVKVDNKTCLLGEGQTDDKGNFRVRTDPACHSITLRFTRGGYESVTRGYTNLTTGEFDVGAIELQSLFAERPGGGSGGGGGGPLKAGRSRMLIPAIAAIAAANIVAAHYALKQSGKGKMQGKPAIIFEFGGGASTETWHSARGLLRSALTGRKP
jgi:hypothetical protein